MRTLLLVCSAGMSTHLLVARMQANAPIDVTVAATAAATAVTTAHATRPVAVMLAPQVRYLATRLRDQLECPVVLLDADAFLAMNAAALMRQAEPYLNAKEAH